MTSGRLTGQDAADFMRAMQEFSGTPERYRDAVWALRNIAQATDNEAALARWQASHAAVQRLYPETAHVTPQAAVIQISDRKRKAK